MHEQEEFSVVTRTIALVVILGLCGISGFLGSLLFEADRGTSHFIAGVLGGSVFVLGSALNSINNED